MTEHVPQPGAATIVREPRAPATGRNFTVVQALRGVAAMWVVLFHASAGDHLPSLTAALPVWIDALVFDFGHYGISVFFGLSGFVIAHSLHDVEVRPGTWGRFMLRRSIRLDPAYWAAIGLAVTMGAISTFVKNEPSDLPSVGSAAAHFAYLQDILGYAPINPAFWTLAYEIQFYAFFAFAMIWRSRAVELGLLGIALLSALGMFDVLISGLFLSLWGSFFVGVLARWAHDDRRWLAALLVLGACLAARSAFGAVAAFTAAGLWVAVAVGWADNGLNWRWLQFLGAISYSLYLIHNPVSGAASFLAHKAVGAGVLADVVVCMAMVAASVVAAAVMWIAIERPSHRWSRRIALRG